MTVDTFNFESDSKACNDTWRAYYVHCAESLTRECYAVISARNEQIKVPAPTEECMTKDAYSYGSDSEACNKVWIDWDVLCYAN